MAEWASPIVQPASKVVLVLSLLLFLLNPFPLARLAAALVVVFVNLLLPYLVKPTPAPIQMDKVSSGKSE